MERQFGEKSFNPAPFYLQVLYRGRLTDEYIDMTLKVLDNLKNEKYYCKMAVAWAIATAWAKQREKTCCYMLDGNNTLNDWTYNKAIQKMLESYRVSDEDKVMLRRMKRV